MARGATEYDSMDAWLKSSPGKGSSGGKIAKWKEDGQLDVWLHTKRLPMTIWRHSFPTTVVMEDKETKEKVAHIWSKKYTCHESEDVLDAMWFRDRDTGERKNPPKRCGLCKFNEWLWQQVKLWMDTHEWDEEKKAWKETKKGGGKGIDPCRTAFKFVSEAKEEENITLHVAGICGIFGKKDPNPDLVEAMKASKIRGTEAWKENTLVKAEYVMCIVNNDKPGDGVQIAIETKGLGEKVKEVIAKVYKSQDINIQKTPYCIRWEFDKKAEFSKMYDATAMMKIQPSPRILKLIRGEAPDLTQIKEPFNQQTMRAILEKHCLLKNVPWDDIFPSKDEEKVWEKEDNAEAAKDAADDEETEEESDDNADEESTVTDDDEDEDEDEDDEKGEKVACDECGKAILMSDAKCPHCGHEYEVAAAEEEEEEPPKKLRSRADIAKEKEKAATPPAKKAAAKKAVKKKAEEEDEDDEDSEIPF